MRSSWVGPLQIAEIELNRCGVEAENDQIKISGPDIESLIAANPGEPVVFIEIKPETLCWIEGRPVHIVELLQPYDSFRTTVGLPVAKRR